jgi:hypothetical protein
VRYSKDLVNYELKGMKGEEKILRVLKLVFYVSHEHILKTVPLYFVLMGEGGVVNTKNGRKRWRGKAGEGLYNITV